MKVAVTGASGYLGAGIAETFRNHGHEVHCLSRKPCGENWVPYSLLDDPRQLPWDNVEVLIHAAYDFTPRHWREIIRTNVDPSIALFQAAAAANVRSPVFISSMSSFDGCRSDYGKAKRMVEMEVLRLGGTVIRPGLVWSEQSGGVMGALERAVTTLPIIPFPDGGTEALQFLIHRSDLSEALVAFAQRPPPPGQKVQSLAHPTALPLRAVLQTIAHRIERRRCFIPIPPGCIMAGLKAAEWAGIPIPFRSDSLVGLLCGNPDPKIDAAPEGITFRPFV